MMIGDYDEDSKTYAVALIADETEVDASPLKEGDEVEIHLTKTEIAYSGQSGEPSTGKTP
jgi:hypothetical protein